MSADHRLACYGTLAPGQANHHELDGLAGHWRAGIVRGWRLAEGQGAALGYPVLLPDPAGGTVAVQLFESAGLPAQWARLDAFEGEGYRRIEIPVETAGGPLPAWIYVAA
ncbi:gamma-glutamylcyclotransferase family protein [Roseomonas sp. USHLN139]|uniref:gamma-glutamylcyclotransferase family protein n=1 Tax=Roseomonas sp. USHLN139 TaxID=3081298 RepID=UPI003B0161BC